MRILALETTNFEGTVAAADGPHSLVELPISRAAGVSRALAPTMQAVLRQVGWQPQDVQLVAVTCGPGSFTGLRAGVTSAKVLAYATHAAVLGLNTLEVIAAQASIESKSLWTIMDAQRQQVFAARYATAPAALPIELQATAILDNSTWLASLDRDSIVSGPGLQKLAGDLPAGASPCPEADWAPRAATVAHLAWLRYSAGDRDDPWTLMPQYFRLSAAEEKLRQQT